VGACSLLHHLCGIYEMASRNLFEPLSCVLGPLAVGGSFVSSKGI
jgi:hypothetical protein